jgi:aspartate carbamoyltransferase catalytic subunit
MSKLSQKHLLGIKDITREDIELIFETADNFKDVINRPIKKVPSLRDVTIANVFFENSTRTRLSFELAQKRLSADVINFSASNSSVKKGETLLDTCQQYLGDEGRHDRDAARERRCSTFSGETHQSEYYQRWGWNSRTSNTGAT